MVRAAIGSTALVVIVVTLCLIYVGSQRSWTPSEMQSNDNLLWPSESFPPSRVTAQKVEVVADAALSLSGAKSATLLTETMEQGYHRILLGADGLKAGYEYTVSLYVKEANVNQEILTARDVMFEFDDPVEGYANVYFDLGKSSVANTVGTIDKAGVELTDGGWVRIWASRFYGTDRAALGIDLLNPEAGGVYAGDGKSGLLIWGAQLEPGDKPRKYVATTTGPIHDLPSGATYHRRMPAHARLTIQDVLNYPFHREA